MMMSGLAIFDVNHMFPSWIVFFTYLNTHAKLWHSMDLAILLVFGITFYVMGMVRVVHSLISYRCVRIVSGHIEKGPF